MDYLNEVTTDHNLKPGRMVILPSSFQGSPRALLQNYQDAMAIVAKHGKPDLFVTFTCNPKWIEISKNVACGQQAFDRPDIVTRVFQMKLKEFIRDITVCHVLGVVIAHIHVIEFQKSLLSHCHMLINTFTS